MDQGCKYNIKFIGKLKNILFTVVFQPLNFLVTFFMNIINAFKNHFDKKILLKISNLFLEK